ncbi:spore germination protein [Agathobacter sp.]
MTKNIDENIRQFKSIYSDCADIKMQEMYLGQGGCCKCFIAYIEVTCPGSGINSSSLGRFTEYLKNVPKDQIAVVLDENRAGLSDFMHLDTVEEAAQAMLTGDAVLFVDGYEQALKLSDQGYPSMSLQETDSEKVIRGSNEGFTDSIKVNTALVRRHLRSTRLKCREVTKGLRSHTNVDILYIKDLVKPGLVETVEQNLESYVIDHVGDSGELEQFAEKKWYSPFPQIQTTKRPDVAVNALLEGRVVVFSNNSPVAIILPTTMNNFLKTADDYYNRTIAASFARVIRYVATFLSMTLPGLYLAVTNFHTQILPTPLLLAFYNARLGCPFPQVLEVLMMELAFELLREAGIRLPGAMGNTIGIVGGLIIGQAAVDANLVSPIVVILVAFTALCSFAIPSEEFAFSFRILKFAVIIMSAWLGYFGFLISLFVVLLHLAKLKSCGYPYMLPFVGSDLSDGEDEKDSIIRFPLRKLWKRPIFTRVGERRKLREKK